MDSSVSQQEFKRNVMASFIQIGTLVLLLSWCFQIIQPFIYVVLWGMIIAVATVPFHQSLTRRLGGRERTAAGVIVLLGLLVIVVPVWMTADSSLSWVRTLSTDLTDGTVAIPPPSDSVREWPLIGEPLHGVWADAAVNLQDTLNQYQTQLIGFGEWMLRLVGATGLALLQFVLALFIAGGFLVHAQGGYRVSCQIARAITPDRGQGLIDLAVATIRSVTKGVLGVALIQSILALIGLLLMGVPAAGIWAGLVLVLAIMQLPPLLLLGPIAVWVFSVAATGPATLFAIYVTVVSLSDAVLKPMMLGRGVDIPMLVILIGAIGGAMTTGIIGLFVGAVVLGLGYTILRAWMTAADNDEDTTEDTSGDAAMVRP